MSCGGTSFRLAPLLICLIWAGCTHDLTPANTHTLVATGYVREVLDATTLCTNNQTLFGARGSDGHYVFSNDFGSTWVDTGGPILGPPGTFQQCEFLHGLKFLATADGKIFRTTPDDWANWTEVSVPVRPLSTTYRPDNLAGNSQYLYYGNYNATLNDGAHIYRSSDNGDHWIEVLSVPDARHVHSIVIDPLHPEHIFVNLGDKGGDPPAYPGYGLWYSSVNGDPGSFVHLSADNDGIDMVFHQHQSMRNEILMEGDGPNAPQILVFHNSDTPRPGSTMALIMGDANPPDGKGSLQGTARCIALTSEDNLFWITKAEGAPDRHRTGIFMSLGPLFEQSVLLEELTATPLAKTLELGPYLFVGNTRIRKPTLQLQ